MRNLNKICKIFDWGAIFTAIFSLIFNTITTKCIYLNNFFCAAAALFCLIYIGYVVYLLIQRPKFDWHLINGHFLRKVVAFVLLVPSFISSLFLLCNSIRICNEKFTYSPKNLVYEEKLYTANDTIRLNKELLCKQTFRETYKLDKLNDTTAVLKCKMPDPGISAQISPSIFWTVYYHFIDPGNQHMTTSQSGRGWSALIALLGVFLLNGLLVSSIVGWIDSRKEKWLKGEVKYPCFLQRNKHYVIIGGNDMVFGIVQQIFAKPKPKPNYLPYIVIQTTRDVEEFRRELFSTLTKPQQQHIIIFYGSRTSKGDLENLYLYNAEEVYILGEPTRTDELEPYHDSINMQCLNCIKEIRTENEVSKVVTCYVMFNYQTTFAAFQASKQQRKIEGKIIFIPFNTHETWAQKVLVNGSTTTPDGTTITYKNIDKEPISYNSDKTVHMIIVGMSKMGVAMAIETAHLAHFPNFVRDNSKRTKITFIDKNAREESDFFMGRFSDLFKLCKWTDVDGNIHNDRFPGNIQAKYWEPQLKNEYSYFNQNFLDIEFEFREGGVEANANREYLKKSIENRNAIVTVAVCLPQPHESIAAALYLPHDVIEQANEIWVYQPESARLILEITKQQENTKYSDEVKYKKLKPFGMQYGGFDENLIDNKLVTYCQCFYELKKKLKKQSTQYKEWTCKTIRQMYEDNPNVQLNESDTIWAIWSNIYQLNMLNYKLRSFVEEGKELTTQVESNKELIAQVEHNRWNMEKLLMGYRPLRDRLIEDKEEINHIVECLSLPDEDAMIKKIKSGSQNEKDIYNLVRSVNNLADSVKKYYSKGPQKIHPNICPYDDAFLPDNDKEYDICFSLAIPFLKQKLEQNQHKTKRQKNNLILILERLKAHIQLWYSKMHGMIRKTI